MTSETRNCQSCKSRFTIEPEDFAFYEKVKVPPPTWCPRCRSLRRLVIFNQHQMFRKEDALTGKLLFSTYPQQSAIKVYDRDYWWSDAFDGTSYGRDVDFSRPFLDQVRELIYEVPWASRSVQQMVNSDYSNQASRLKNCYLCFNGADSEDCLYGTAFNALKECLDFSSVNNCELCYEIFSVGNCYKTLFASESVFCNDSRFLIDCRNCSDCFGCVGLRHKKYCIFNEQYTKEEYEQQLASFDLGSYRALTAMQTKMAEFRLRFPVRYMHGDKNENASGEYIYNSKNTHASFHVISSENIKYSQDLAEGGARDSYDYTVWGGGSELIYEASSSGEGCRNVRFAFDCWPASQDIEYSMNCHSSSNLFGCVGLKTKTYCILNKEYSKDEYFALREKIIAHMDAMPYTDKQGRVYRYGEFFPPEFSPLAYNESEAQIYYPLSKDMAEASGFVWRDPDRREFETTMDASDLPDHINDASDDIVKAVISCHICRRGYRILPQELQLYRRLVLPLPRLCHDCRLTKRLEQRNPPKFWHRTCMCGGVKSQAPSAKFHYENTATHQHGESPCQIEFETSYAPERPEIVYCESCYNSEVA